MSNFGILHIASGKLVYVEKFHPYDSCNNNKNFSESILIYINPHHKHSNIYGFYIYPEKSEDQQYITLLTSNSKKLLFSLIKNKTFRRNISMDIFDENYWSKEVEQKYGIIQECEFEIIQLDKIKISTATFWKITKVDEYD